MMNSLRVTLTHSEDLPLPVAVRLCLPDAARLKQLSFLKAFEAPAAHPFQLKFFHSGEILGLLRLVLPEEVSGPQGKWLPVSLSDCGCDIAWDSVTQDPASGPRVRVVVEPVRPLSPILEMTEANECSVVESRPDMESPGTGDELEIALRTLQCERERHSESQKELQLKVMELQQTLVRERWESRIALEQSEFRYKGELNQAALALEKVKSAHRKETAANESLTAKFADLEQELREVKQRCETAHAQDFRAEMQRLEDAFRRKSIEVGELTSKLSFAESNNALLSAQLADTEKRLYDATHSLSRVRTDFEASLNESQSLSLELTSTKSVLRQLTDQSQYCSLPNTNLSTPSEGRKTALVTMVEAENSTLSQQIAEQRKTINRLKGELMTVQGEGETKDREIRSLSFMLDSMRAKLTAYETTIKVLKAAEGTEVRDAVDDALRDAVQRKPAKHTFIKLAEGMYAYGDRHVVVTLRRGEVAIKTRSRGTITLDEFLSDADEPRARGYIAGKMSTEGRGRRPQSADLDPRGNHYRSLSNYIDLIRNTEASESSSAARLHTDCSGDNGTERNKGRDLTPSRDYLRPTISSQHKVTLKSRVLEGRKSRVLRL